MDYKLRIYLDTSVPSALFHGTQLKQDFTGDLFDNYLPSCNTFISEIVLAEIRATVEDELREKLYMSVSDFTILPVTEKIEKICDEYLTYLTVPRNDALHIAIASVYGADYLLTWNMRHMAREKTMNIVDIVNLNHSLPAVFIINPQDFIGGERND